MRLPTQRDKNFHNRLGQYFRETELLNFSQKKPFYDSFVKWCAKRNYTYDDVAQALKNAPGEETNVD